MQRYSVGQDMRDGMSDILQTLTQAEKVVTV
jgi:hypothetical protein